MIKKGIVIVVILLILGGLVISLFNLTGGFKQSPLSLLPNSLIKFQALPIRGKITRVSGKTLFIQGADGVSGTINIRDKAQIVPAPKDNAITLNKDVILNVEKDKDGIYVVSSIIYIPDNIVASSSAIAVPKEIIEAAYSSSSAKVKPSLPPYPGNNTATPGAKTSKK